MDAYTLAKAYFDVKEYDRAAHFLHGCNSKKAYFLYMYSRYLVRAILRCHLPSMRHPYVERRGKSLIV